MGQLSNDDTIAAIATCVGESGIGIVRISGREACGIVDGIFRPRKKKSILHSKGYTVHYGWIVPRSGHASGTSPGDGGTAVSDIIDEVLVLVMRAPCSFTREDVVEIHCHGGQVAVRRVLEQVLAGGCRLAQPGEFTRRAFLNGRIDLSQAEAVLDIVRAKSEAALKIGVQQLRGSVSKEVNKLRELALAIVSELEARIDFPDDLADTQEHQECRRNLEQFNAQLAQMVSLGRLGRLYREGVSVVICGRPNTGKSSLLNALVRHERSIVTPIAGTTRDTVEECIELNGILLRLIDTAGILSPRNIIEKKAVARSSACMRHADVILLVFDASLPLSSQDKKIISRLSSKRAITIAVLNKTDLKRKIDTDAVAQKFGRCIEVSAKKARHLDRLEEAILGSIRAPGVTGPESALIGSLRHIQALSRAAEYGKAAASSLEQGASVELVAQDVKDALGCLDEIVGKHFSEDLLEKIFDKFCIGK